MSQQVIVIARGKAREGKAEEVGKVLSTLLQPTRVEDGCVFYRLFSDMNAGLFYFYELWETAESLAKHAESAHLFTAREALKDLLAEPMDVSVVTEVSP